ncbi:MAG: phosphoadenylyl-sulfate reductase [Bacteroidetes bacterium CG18_big_fil_WC_8_21_14_2_50_41_14]|nr:MAG: phosphoadenylyl-sulfate reductase [Bacteroidetes bacterium CG18_big_fil_WC_8_21_14_2_50_41_14]PIY34770.1 MAG: phosphoadenylyl-sulfate reductase [Bacteroidetes bacterium CG_4_10_14_3_um_filter_42_6]PJB57685.1 MAG: phosphoadenylyl-sulfate reductase [Bacteroidetes bacterium CG_4_9_14_3_um_filter_41_19]
MIDSSTIADWNIQLSGASAQQIVAFFLDKFKGKIALSTSLGLEDQVLTQMVAETAPSTRIFTLDTGRLFPEAYDLMDRTSKKYKINLEVFFPNAHEVEEMVAKKGINLFYDSIENRKLCCRLRKLVPLARAMQGLDAWITGLRREQSVTRENMQAVEWDASNNMLKINPLIDWTESQTWDYIKEHKIPVNPLHKKGFASIGCQPCTRAIEPGEEVRAGRWWWENPETKECGLHKK